MQPLTNSIYNAVQYSFDEELAKSREVQSIEERLIDVITSKPHNVWTLKELINELEEPDNSIRLREAVWQLLDRNKIELTADRRIKLPTRVW
jgi:transposase